MISPKLRLLLVLLFVVCAIICLVLKIWYAAITLVATALILLLGHFKHGSMHMVLHALRGGKIQEAQQLIGNIKRPDWLSPRFKAYYYFALSVIATYSQDIDAAAANAKKALESGNLPSNEQGILYYNLARTAYEKQAWSESKKHLASLKQTEVQDLHLKKRIEELEQALSNR